MTTAGAPPRRTADRTEPASAGSASPCPSADRRVHVYGFEDPTWTLVLGDDLSLSSIDALLDRRRAVGPTVVFVEVDDDRRPAERFASPGLVVEWVARGSGDRGDDRALEAAVAAADLPAGSPSVWVAAASLVDRGVCRNLRTDHGLRVGPLRAVLYRGDDDTAA
ncbi:SIP domain-containing protein [Patulibacter minatonensis]|uniref:SIP domain-containing protein n=1 Tax=Patulibacter minatonensis TaxID=298163 RepID=UPI00047EFAA6|nr:SIP domain-containing protein [Patulibacter minatonensis]